VDEYLVAFGNLNREDLEANEWKMHYWVDLTYTGESVEDCWED